MTIDVFAANKRISNIDTLILLIHERDITIFKKSLELGMEIMKSVERLPSVCDILASNPTTA